MKLPGRTLPSAGMNSPPELASKIVTLRMSPMPNRMSLGRLRSGKSVISLRRRLGQDGRDLGRDSDKGIRNVLRVVLPRPDIPARGPAGRHQGAAAHGSYQER